jgi:hypothetical protein
VDDILVQHAEVYAKQRKIVFAEELGGGIHGVVQVAEDNVNFRRFAVKFHRYADAYLKERTIYQRLAEHGVVTVRGFSVPQLLGWSDECLAVEMTIVDRPFVLDFAGAYLDEPPEFTEETWADWTTEKEEQFGDRWREVQAVLAVLRSHGVTMVDVSPSNIAFRE